MGKYQKSADYYRMQRIERRSKRMAMARHDPANFKRGSDGRVTKIVETTAVCSRCQQPFTYRMTTKPRKYCPVCYPIRQRELKRASEATRVLRAAAPMPLKQVVPYAGYDPTELPLYGEEDDQHEEDHGGSRQGDRLAGESRTAGGQPIAE